MINVKQEQALAVIGELFLQNSILVQQVEQLVRRNQELEQECTTAGLRDARPTELPETEPGESSNSGAINGKGRDNRTGNNKTNV